MELYKRIKSRREELGLSQEDLAFRLGYKSRSSINKIELGLNDIPQSKIKQFAEALNTTPAYLMGWEDSPSGNFIPVKGTVPIVGKIAAGIPLLAQENIEGYRFINLPHPEEYFFLRVKGDSMINAGITDRSLVLIHKQPYANNGDIVACRVNGDEATLKRYRQQDDMVMLLPENPAYFPQLVPCSAFEDGTAEIIGTARQIVIDL